MKARQMSAQRLERAPKISANDYLARACEKFPVVARTIDEFGDSSLSDYIQNLTMGGGTAYQPLDDLLEVVHQYASPLLGAAVATRVVHDLAAYPVVLTANHHGVDYFAQSIQGSLIFALNRIVGATPATTVPVFACGGVPLDNLTYPLGLLLYRVNYAELGAMPKKLPVFSNRFRREMVSAAAPFNPMMVQSAKKRFDKMVSEKIICPTLSQAVHEIFKENYCAPSIVDLPDYSQQSVVLNNTIWKRLFPQQPSASDIVYLEMEKIVSALLEKDLVNYESLAWRVMFDPALRERILDALDGAKACWERKKLVQRLRRNLLNSQPHKAVSGCGTIFFWGINNSGRRIPLYLEPAVLNGGKFRGVDDRGDTFEMAYTPQAIIEGLHAKKLLPSLFTCFLVVSFARGLACAGGYFQGEYLPAMQRGVVRALEESGDYHQVGHLVSQVPTGDYISGMLALMTRIEEDCLIPAGPVEIIAGGGITSNDIEQMRSLTVRDAHLAALFETVPDIVPAGLNAPDWKRKLAGDCSRLLEDKVVVKL